MPPTRNNGGRGRDDRPYGKDKKDNRSNPQKMKDALEDAKAALKEYQSAYNLAHAAPNARHDDLNRYPIPGVAYTFDHIISWIAYIPANCFPVSRRLV